MALIGVVCADAEDRRRLALIAGESGHQVHGAGRLHEAVEILRELRPRVMLLVDSAQEDASVLLREVLRAAPLMPVVIALKGRDSARAVALMRTGAAEVVPSPWTRESLQACLAKSLRHQGTAVALAPRRRPWGAPVFAATVALFLGLCMGWAALERGRRQAEEAAALAAKISWEMPYRHPAAMAFEKGRLWVADWHAQSVFVHDAATREVVSVAHFPSEMPVALTVGADAAWSATASGAIVRHAKDAPLTPLERAPAPRTLALAFDGLYLWSIEDGKTPMIKKRLPDSNVSALASFRYPGVRPAGLAWANGELWSLDSANRELVRHNVERPDENTGRVPLPEYADGRYKPAAMGFDGKNFWTIGERQPRGAGPARLFRHGEAKL